MTYVPFTTSDICWCQPFDGPTHPFCPMHGRLSLVSPDLFLTEEEIAAIERPVTNEEFAALIANSEGGA